MTRIIFACPECSSTNVGRDASASWDVDAQEWVISYVHDDAWCDDCGQSDFNLNEIEVDENGDPIMDEEEASP